MTSFKPQNRKSSLKEDSDRNAHDKIANANETHDEYEREYFDNYEAYYYNSDDEDEDYTTWCD